MQRERAACVQVCTLQWGSCGPLWKRLMRTRMLMCCCSVRVLWRNSWWHELERERQYYQGGRQATVWVVLLWLSPDREARLAIESVSSLGLGPREFRLHCWSSVCIEALETWVLAAVKGCLSSRRHRTHVKIRAQHCEVDSLRNLAALHPHLGSGVERLPILCDHFAWSAHWPVFCFYKVQNHLKIWSLSLRLS